MRDGGLERAGRHRHRLGRGDELGLAAVDPCGGRDRSCRPPSARASRARRRPRPSGARRRGTPRGRRRTGRPPTSAPRRTTTGSSPRSRMSGVGMRSSASTARWAKRPLSQIQASLTSPSSRARTRTTSPRRTSTRTLHPTLQCPQTLSPLVRSNGRATKRYGVAVSAPTGQICTVLPLKGERKSSPAAIDTRSPAPAREQLQEPVAADLVAEPGAPRAEHAPLAVQVHRAATSGRAWGRPASPRGTASPPGPNARAWSCSGHSPPRSQIGQSSGWFSSRNSRFASCAWAAGSLVNCVATAIPGRHGHRARGGELGLALDLHVALAARAGRREVRVVAEPGDLDAELLGRPDDERAGGDAHLLAVDRERDRAGSRADLRGLVRLQGAAALADVRLVLLGEVLQARVDDRRGAVRERAERPEQDVACPCRPSRAGPPRGRPRPRCARAPGWPTSCPRGTGVHFPQDSCA